MLHMRSVVHRSGSPSIAGGRSATGITRTVVRSKPRRATRRAGTALLTSLNTLFSEEDIPPGPRSIRRARSLHSGLVRGGRNRKFWRADGFDERSRDFATSQYDRSAASTTITEHLRRGTADGHRALAIVDDDGDSAPLRRVVGFRADKDPGGTGQLVQEQPPDCSLGSSSRR